MNGFLDFLTTGSTPPTTTSSTTGGTSIPLYYSQYQNAILSQANQIAGTPLDTYQGPRIAQTNPQQQQAFDYLGQNATNWQQPLDQAQAMTAQAGNVDPSQVNQWMSPYMSNVTDEISRLGNQNLNETLLPGLNSQFMSAGQFGSGRNATMDERLVRDTGQNILGQQATALNTGYNAAENNMLQSKQIQGTAGANLGTLARTDQNLTTGTAGALEASGATQRGIEQSNLDLGYQDFLNQQAQPRQNLALMSSALNGQTIPTSTTSSTTAPYSGPMGPSPLATLGSLAATAYGTTQAKARGGVIRRYAAGGFLPGRSTGRSPLSMVGGRRPPRAVLQQSAGPLSRAA